MWNIAHHFGVTVTLTADLVSRRIVSGALFEVRFQNLLLDSSWEGSVAYHFCVTVTLLTLTSFLK